jgi:hypothetical protein
MIKPWLAANVFLCMLGLATLIFAEERNSRPVPFSECPKTAFAPKIDAKLDDSCWTNTSKLSPFVTINGDFYPKSQSKAYLLWDEKNLYVGVEFDEPEMDKIVAKVTARDGGVWSDDCLEIFLKPAEGKDYFHFIVNSKGVLQDSKGRSEITWNADWKTATAVTPKGWSVEAAIPLASIGVIGKSGNSLMFNLCRNRSGAHEYSAWSNPGGSFHNTDRFAELQMVENASFVWSVDQPAEIRSATGSLTMRASGATFKYPAEVATSLNGASVKKFPGEFACVFGESHVKEFPFDLPGNAGAGASLSVKRTDGTPVLRTGVLPLIVSDPFEFTLAQINDGLKSVKIDRLPGASRKIAESWNARIANARSVRDTKSLQKLSGEIAVLSLAAKLDNTSSAVSGCWFVPPAFTYTQYDFIPEPGIVGKPLQVSVLRGEYEPAALNVLAFEELTELQISLGDLRSGTDVLSKENCDISIVKNWYQSGIDNLSSSKPVIVPELLLKDYSILEMDKEKERNRLNFDEKIGPEVSDTLRAMSVPAFENRQFWLLFHIPENQKAGEYRGVCTVTNKGVKLFDIPVQVKVLPLSLEATAATFSMYNHTRHTMGKNPKRDTFYEEMLAMCQRYGMNSLFLQEGGSVQRQGEIVTAEVSPMRKGLELRKKYGLTAHTPIMGLHWFPNNGRMDSIWKMEPSDIRDDKNEIVQEFLAVCREAKKIAADIGIDVSIYTYDEPGYDPTGKAIEKCRAQDERVHEAGLKCSAAITRDAFLKLPADNLDLPVLSGEGLAIGERKAKDARVPLAWHYYHPLENPIHDRLLTGLVTWYNRYQGACPYALAALGGWDDWKDYGAYRPERYIYDGANKPVPTLQFESYREGVDDYKLLEMIERRVEKLKGRTLAESGKAVVTEAGQLLKLPPKAFIGNVSELEKTLTVGDFHAFRTKCLDMLVKLEALK